MIARCSPLFEYPPTALIVITSAGATTSFLDGNSSLKFEDVMCMLAKNIGKMMTRSDGRNQYIHQGGDHGNDRRRECLKCYECENVGHMRVDCPVAQRRELKCPECRGVGHTRRESPNSIKEKEIPLQLFDDSESGEDAKVIKNLVAFGARKERSNESSDSDVDTDDAGSIMCCLTSG